MSKHLGNILEPIPLMERARRRRACAGSCSRAARRGPRGGSGTTTLQEIVRKVLLTYWNTAAFQSLYGRAVRLVAAGGRRRRSRSEPCSTGGRCPSCTLSCVMSTSALDDFDTQRAGRLLADFVDDLSNWYVRRSRRRFWDGDPAALATLHECLDVLTRLLAPVHAVRHRAGLAGPGPAGRRPTRPSRCTSPTGRRPIRRRDRPAAVRADGPGAPAGRARPGRARRVRGEDPPAARSRADRCSRLGDTSAPSCVTRSPTSSTSSTSPPSTRPPASSWTRRPRPTSAPSASGSASRRPRWPPRSPRPTRRRWRSPCGSATPPR